jgi:hypothetical protein
MSDFNANDDYKLFELKFKFGPDFYQENLPNTLEVMIKFLTSDASNVTP